MPLTVQEEDVDIDNSVDNDTPTLNVMDVLSPMSPSLSVDDHVDSPTAMTEAEAEPPEPDLPDLDGRQRDSHILVATSSHRANVRCSQSVMSAMSGRLSEPPLSKVSEGRFAHRFSNLTPYSLRLSNVRAADSMDKMTSLRIYEQI